MTMSDAELVRRLWEKDEQALSLVQQQYGSYCRSIAQRILGNARDAEECVNDALLKTWSSIPPNSPDSLKAYIGRITRNLSFNLYQKQRAEKRGGSGFETVLDELAECIPGGREPEEEVLMNELSSEIDRFLSSLPKEKRMLFVSRYFYAESIPEIAKRFSISKNAASVRLNRLRKELRAHLKERGFEP
ncbi:MAG: RNA polymerase sigma factor [Lachnospiraceae bacterium]|nr:RNA polymerase sigma factor [Lachnospiraceae bacterium]